MERALDPNLIRVALGAHGSLPSPEEVSALIAEAELAMLMGTVRVSETLVDTAWYLHSIASSNYALRTYGLQRQRSAFRVAGHVFDLVTKTAELGQADRLKYCFASQIAYVRGELDPNAIAVYNQNISLPEVALLSDFAEVALSCGVAFLGFDVGYVYETSRKLQDEVRRLITDWDVADVFATPLGSAAGVVSGARDLITFLVYGRVGALERARETS